MDTKKTLEEMTKTQVSKFDSFRKKGQVNADEIFKILKSKSSFQISRLKVLGSIGRRRSIEVCNQPDFDLVVFITLNNIPSETQIEPDKIQSTFDKVIKDFERSFYRHFSEINKRDDIAFETKTYHSLQIKMKDISSSDVTYLSFDLHPTQNLLSPDEEEYPDNIKEQLQTKRCLDSIPNLPNSQRRSRCYYYCALAERNIAFVEMQSDFVQGVIRLAKLWNKRVIWKGSQKMYGRSTMIEFLAIAAGCLEENIAASDRREKCILNAFEQFLRKIIHPDPHLLEFYRYQANLNLQLPYDGYEETLEPVDESSFTGNSIAAHLIREIKFSFEIHAKHTSGAIKYYKKFGCGQKFGIEDYFGV